MRTVILFLCMVLNITVFAQKSVSQAEIDQVSYDQFQNKQFKELKQTVKEAIQQNIDFYYLRLRAGILAYNKKKYEYAIPQFKKALEFVPTDTLSKEYLYYAYLFSDRKETARDFASKQDVAFQQKVGYKKKPFDFIGIDGGAVYTDNIKKNKDNTYISILRGKAERSLNGNLYFGEFFFQNTIKNRLHINNSFSIFNTDALYQIQVKLPLVSTPLKNEQRFNNLNFQYNLGLSYVTRKEWVIAIGFGYFRVKGNTFTANPLDTTTNTVLIVKDTAKINSFLGSITIAKRWKYVQPYIQFSVSNLNGVKQFQTEGGLVYYPLGNYNFYGATSATFLRNDSSNHFVIGQRIGYKITNWFWNEINFNYGNLANYISNNGFLTYNTSNPIRLQAGIDLKFYAGKHFQINAGYTFQKRDKEITELFQELPPPSPPVTSYKKENYITHIFKTSLLWNF